MTQVVSKVGSLVIFGCLLSACNKQELTSTCVTVPDQIVAKIEQTLEPPNIATGLSPSFAVWVQKERIWLIAAEIEGTSILEGDDDVGVWASEDLSSLGRLEGVNLEAIQHSAIPQRESFPKGVDAAKRCVEEDLRKNL
ncbi:MAG: hypothetical protein ABIS18_01585 [Actinomycetota bacterium]